MLGVLVLIVFFLLGVVLIMRFVTQFAENLTGKLVTDQFRTAEFILEHHQPPETWMQPKSKFQAKTKALLLTRMDKLINFFETCPFFEDEADRTLLLVQLRAERDGWEAKPLATIMAQPQR